MYHWFLIKCYFIGLLAASGIGPIFILTFNRSALHGFSHGLATALGSATGDAVFFSLALAGILGSIQDSRTTIIALDIVGGIVLLFLAQHLLRKTYRTVSIDIGAKESVLLTFFRSLTLTLVNPMSVLFFVVITMKVLSTEMDSLKTISILLGSCMVIAGSISILGTVSLIASCIGHKIDQSHLRIISYLSGSAFLGFGLYLFGHLALMLLRGS